MSAHPRTRREETQTNWRRAACLALAALLLVACAAGGSSGASGAPAGFYVESTGHILANPFLQFWVNNDGEHALGLPVSDLVELNGRSAQYFQYGVLVSKGNQTVSRIRAGEHLLNELRDEPAMVDGRRAPASRAVQGLPPPETVGQTNVTGRPPAPQIDPAILPFWQQWGGADLLGAPISMAYGQGDSRVQWFEYGRVDVRREGAVLAEVGLELARRSDIPTGPADRGSLPLFDPARFATFTGDGTVPNADDPFDPVRLEIPRIQVDAGIEITTVLDGVMTNPVDPWQAGWYASFARPGEWTNVVIAGHRDWWGYGPVVFWNLGYLQPGDKIYLVGADGAGATYVVESTTVVPSTVDPQTIISDVGYEALTLITCGGTWTGTEYTSRIIVRAYRI